MSTHLEAIVIAEQECIDANVEENDYTIFSRQDLEFELELVQQAIAKRLLFIRNQVRPSIPVALPVLMIESRLCRGT